jgi:anti-sigma factor RsiW
VIPHHPQEHVSAERLQAFLDGELPPGEVAQAEAHLAGCRRCAEELEGWRALFQDLAALPAYAPARRFADRVLAAALPRERRTLAGRLRAGLAGLRPAPRGAHLPGDLLQDLADGALAGRREAHARAHLDACAACASEFRAWRTIHARLARLERFGPAPGFAERVLARLHRAPVPEPVPAWRRLVVAAGSLVPRTRRAWAAVSGVALAPAITAALVLYAVFSHRTLTPQALASFAAWKLGDLFALASGGLGSAALRGSQLLGMDFLVEAVLDAPWIVAGGALLYSIVSVLALRVLYKNLSSGHRHAPLSFR